MANCETPAMVLRPLTLIGIILSIVTGIALGVLTHLMTRDNTPADTTVTLSAAMKQVSENYVEEISQEELLSHAIDGMMRRLDDHSDYLDRSAFSYLKENTEGHFGGIGIELGLQDGYFTVIAPIDGTPAAEAGMQSGDRITKLNGEWVKGLLLTDIIDALRGAPGTSVKLGVERATDNADVIQNLEFDLTRADIEFASVRSRLLEPGIAYIRISAFQNRTGDDVYDALANLTAATTAPLEGLVVDLRNNPGGTLQSSVEVADHFLDQGLIVYTEGRLKSSYAKYRATKGDLLAGLPIVVLINSGSASASEIVAGALQDHGRAQLMGSTSYGKGSVQSVLPLDHDQALKITTAYYFTPNGRSIHKKGIDPDIVFEGDDETMLAEAVAVLKAQESDGLRASL